MIWSLKLRVLELQQVLERMIRCVGMGNVGTTVVRGMERSVRPLGSGWGQGQGLRWVGRWVPRRTSQRTRGRGAEVVRWVLAGSRWAQRDIPERGRELSVSKR